MAATWQKSIRQINKKIRIKHSSVVWIRSVLKFPVVSGLALVLWRSSLWRRAYPETSGNFAHQQKISQHLSKEKGQKCLLDSSLFRALRYLVYFQKRNVKHIFLRISIKICQKYSIFVLRVIRSHWHYQACPASDWEVTYLPVDPVHYSVPLYNNHCSLQQNSRTLTFVERCTMYYVDLVKPKS